MSKIQITTLTPVHIGSGNFLQHNMEFVQTALIKDPEKRYLRVVDNRKVLNLIGEEPFKRWSLNMDIWRRRDLKDLVKHYAPDSKVVDYTKRRINLGTLKVRDTDTLKECIHNGFGLPYIPGSSIKGAIRTAVLSSMTSKINGLSGKIRNRLGRISAESIEKELFGDDPNSDVFRFLQVGDAYFEREVEIALRLVMRLNITESERTLIPEKTRPQLVEAIDKNKETTFQLKRKHSIAF